MYIPIDKYSFIKYFVCPVHIRFLAKFLPSFGQVYRLDVNGGGGGGITYSQII